LGNISMCQLAPIHMLCICDELEYFKITNIRFFNCGALYILLNHLYTVKS
jgi:hypothetical protein